MLAHAVLGVGDGHSPHSILDRSTVRDDRRVGRCRPAGELATRLEDGENNTLVIEQPVVITRERTGIDEVTGEPSNIFTRGDIVLRDNESPTSIVHMWHGDNAHPSNMSSTLGSFANKVQPVLMPKEIVALSGQKELKRIALFGRVVGVLNFQVKCFVIKGAKKIVKQLFGEQLQLSQPLPWRGLHGNLDACLMVWNLYL